MCGNAKESERDGKTYARQQLWIGRLGKLQVAQAVLRPVHIASSLFFFSFFLCFVWLRSRVSGTAKNTAEPLRTWAHSSKSSAVAVDGWLVVSTLDICHSDMTITHTHIPSCGKQKNPKKCFYNDRMGQNIGIAASERRAAAKQWARARHTQMGGRGKSFGSETQTAARTCEDDDGVVMQFMHSSVRLNVIVKPRRRHRPCEWVSYILWQCQRLPPACNVQCNCSLRFKRFLCDL